MNGLDTIIDIKRNIIDGKRTKVKSKIFLLMTFLIVVSEVSGLENTQVAKANTISILALDTSGDYPFPVFDTPILDALTGTTYTEVSPSDFASADLSVYDVLYVGSTFQDGMAAIPSQEALNALNARKNDIANFVKSGHGIVALSEPVGTGCYTWLPITVTASAGGGNAIDIVEQEHPVMRGLTNAGLSNWGASYHNIFEDTGSLTTLAVASDLGNSPVTLAGRFGNGRIVLTSQDPDFHFVISPRPEEQCRDFVQNAIDWAAIPEPGTVLLLGLGGLLLRKCRK